ncbi:hypothetical protein Misp02_30330 [Microtetraspora sp. NBRC 16547]|nr:hypothetical protein Misp02_30330 [Microtetraspora sp. NBRC 16547]
MHWAVAGSGRWPELRMSVRRRCRWASTSAWITTARAADLPHLHAFTRALDQDRDAVQAAVTLPFHNGGAEGVNTKTKRIMRQMHGRSGFALLRHRILLA